MLKRIQKWLGGQAMISVPGFLVRIIGVRHHLCDDDFKRECPAVHHSWDEWFNCSQDNISAWSRRMMEQLWANRAASREEQAKFESRMESARHEATSIANSLRW